jgi:hypothetical protein
MIREEIPGDAAPVLPPFERQVAQCQPERAHRLRGDSFQRFSGLARQSCAWQLHSFQNVNIGNFFLFRTIRQLLFGTS